MLLLIFAVVGKQSTAQNLAGDSDLRNIVRETGEDLPARAARLETLGKSSSPNALGALILAAYTRMRIETQGNQNVYADLNEVIKSSQPGTWQNLIANVGLVGAHHQDGDNAAVVPLAEKLLQGKPDQQLKRQLNEIPPIIQQEVLGIAPGADVSTTYDDAIRVPLALAYKRLKRDKDALRVFSEITNQHIRADLGKGELSAEAQNFKPKSTTSTTPSKNGEQPEIPLQPKQAAVTTAAKATPIQPIEGSKDLTWLVWLGVVIVATGGAAWLFLRKSSR